MKVTQKIGLVLTLSLIAIATTARAESFDLALAADLFTPSFRGDASTSYLGWDVFGDPGDTVLNDTTPDLGTGTGSFVTTNGEDHQSGSFNYYSSFGSVSEDVTFSTDGTNGSGFTTVVVQAKTLFGGWGTDIEFGPIDGVAPTQVLQAINANGSGQLFAKYELPGTADSKTFAISSGAASMVSFDRFAIETVWSPSGFANVSAIATPEPAAALLGLIGLVGLGIRRQR